MLCGPVSDKLTAPLAAIFRDKNRPESERSLATSILADYAANDPHMLADLLMTADSKAYVSLFRTVERQADKALPVFEAELAKRAAIEWNDPPLDRTWSKPDAAVVERIESAAGPGRRTVRPLPDDALGRLPCERRGFAGIGLPACPAPPLRRRPRCPRGGGLGPRRSDLAASGGPHPRRGSKAGRRASAWDCGGCRNEVPPSRRCRIPGDGSPGQASHRLRRPLGRASRPQR